MKPMLIVIRGLPGSGKSTLAGKLVGPSKVMEADQFFMMGGRYAFDPSRLGEAHADCQSRVRKALATGTGDVAVANTFTQGWEVAPYIAIAQELGCRVRILVCRGQWQNVHGVPPAAVARMLARWEPIAGEEEVLSRP